MFALGLLVAFAIGAAAGFGLFAVLSMSHEADAV
jgi:hypothetical protein